MSEFPQISFGIIVLNGEPFTRHNLRSLYPFAHEIIVVEGASPKAASIATPDGHSVDHTLEVLRCFKEEEDPENKLTIVVAEDHGYSRGFWPGEKDEQSQAYAVRATGDYLWQVDIDEFYKPEDMKVILNMLATDPEITQLNFKWLNFWGGFNYLVDGLFLQQHYQDLGGIPRLFKWGPGYCYVTHRPPTVVNGEGIDTRSGKWVKGDHVTSKGIYCYHYSSVFPEAVKRKMKYYKQSGWESLGNFEAWYRDTFCRVRQPFRIHHVTGEISWLKRYNGTHPPQIDALQVTGKVNKLMRQNDDLEGLLVSRRYRLGVTFFDICAPLLLRIRRGSPTLVNIIKRLAELAFSPSRLI